MSSPASVPSLLHEAQEALLDVEQATVERTRLRAGVVFCSSSDLDTRIASTRPAALKIVQPRLSGPRSSYLSAVLNSFSTKRSILIGAGLDGKSDCLSRASKQISSISPRSSKYNWNGNGPEAVGTLRTLLFFRRVAQFSKDVFGGHFAVFSL